MSDVVNNALCDAVTHSCQFFQIDISGQVQGVGFRPYLYQLAMDYQLTGVVYNHGQGVTAFIKATTTIIKDFIGELRANLPPLASIDEVRTCLVDQEKVKTFKVLPVFQGVDKRPPSTHKQAVTLEQLTGFSIAISKQNAIDTEIASDAATCSACVAELLDNNNRRFRYPFINCTHCGPRYSIIEKLPYDRSFTSMQRFPMCPACQGEYDSVDDRRFHAQPNACSVCGPALILFKSTGQETVNIENSGDYPEQDIILQTIKLIKQGKVIAIKGVGGYHLVCDANNHEAVQRLRDKKQRKTKPLSLMMANLDALEQIAEISKQAAKYLTSSSAPITLVKKKENKQAEQLELLAPNMNSFGVMLPYSPLHHLLFQQQDEQGNYYTDESLCLVMTSANLRGAPLIYQEQELHQLASLSDYILSHNREIVRRIDDSIVNCLKSDQQDGIVQETNEAVIIRRARGMAPKAINLTVKPTEVVKSTLAVGGFLKNSICLTKGNKAYLSQYIGDLSNPDNCRYLQQSVEQFMSMLQIKPEQVVCDLHPDFYSSQFAKNFADQHQIPLIKVQHHHAHCAAIACEHQLNEPYLGLSLDGVGLGNDGNAWGGECLFIEYGQAQRLAHFKNILLPGADIAAKQPWRIATAFLMQQNLTTSADEKFAKHQAYDLVKQMITKQINCPTTSSAGRLFDLAAALLGLCDINSFEAEAAMLLESAATKGQALMSEKLFTITSPQTQQTKKSSMENQLDFTPLLLALPKMNASDGAATFHQQVALGISEWLVTLTENTTMSQCKNVVLSGGCFLNVHLTALLKQRLIAQGFNVFTAKNISPNDSSLALGQAWAAIEPWLNKEQSFSLMSKENNNNNNTNHQGDLICA